METKTITDNDFRRLFNVPQCRFPKAFHETLQRTDTRYAQADKVQLSEHVLSTLKLIHSPRIQRSAEENLDAWEKGWMENLMSLDESSSLSDALKPKYFRPSKFLRFEKDLVAMTNPNLEYDLFTLIRLHLFSSVLSSYDAVYEFGCGTCQNLVMVSEMYPEKFLYGLDWASSSAKIARTLHDRFGKNIDGRQFDMTSPAQDFNVRPNSCVMTIHAMEQIGARHEAFIQFLLKKKPALVMHLEPILELYDETNLLDYLALVYSQKRNYLSGLLTSLRKLEQQKGIEIVQVLRPYIGGVVHEASLVLWHPI
ncbi:MAG: class I SAM-dependent methyltransferase [Chitinivibrionales bacterium]